MGVTTPRIVRVIRIVARWWPSPGGDGPGGYGFGSLLGGHVIAMNKSRSKTNSPPKAGVAQSLGPAINAPISVPQSYPPWLFLSNNS